MRERSSSAIDAGDVEHSAADPLTGHPDDVAAANVAAVRARGHLRGDQPAGCLVTDDERGVAVVDALDDAAHESIAVDRCRTGPADGVELERSAAEDAAEADRDSGAQLAGAVPEGR